MHKFGTPPKQERGQVEDYSAYGFLHRTVAGAVKEFLEGLRNGVIRILELFHDERFDSVSQSTIAFSSPRTPNDMQCVLDFSPFMFLHVLCPSMCRKNSGLGGA